MTNIFVACAEGSSDAHRLILAVASQTASPVYVDVDQFDDMPAAVAVRAGTRVLDLVAGEAMEGPRGIMRRRDLVNECSFLVVVAPRLSALECRWWSDFRPECRLVAVTYAHDASMHEGSIVCPVDLASGKGLAEVLDALRAAASAGSSTD